MMVKSDPDIQRSPLIQRDDDLPALARRAVETYLLAQFVISPDKPLPASILNIKSGCFVSIRTDHDLRGCIGTIEPAKENLAEEIINNAIHAATQDPRFAPVSSTELPNLHYSVDVLEVPEPARIEDLDPAEFGVIVADEGGMRRGLLLPKIEGVETSEQQIQIAARKAGISPNTPLVLQRFRVRRYTERPDADNHTD